MRLLNGGVTERIRPSEVGVTMEGVVKETYLVKNDATQSQKGAHIQNAIFPMTRLYFHSA